MYNIMVRRGIIIPEYEELSDDKGVTDPVKIFYGAESLESLTNPGEKSEIK